MSRITIDRRGDRRGDARVSTDLLVDGALLTRQEIAAEVANFSAATPGESWKAAERGLILRLALRQRAARLGIVAVPQADADGRFETDEDATLRSLLEAEVVVPLPTEAEIVAFHAAHSERFKAPDLFDASHILFLAAAEDTAARSEARRKAMEAAALLAREPERFAALASALSACTSAQQGGALGQISSGETAPEFDTALHKMAPGEISAPVETQFGVHIIALSRRVEGVVLPLAVVRNTIAGRLVARTAHRATAAYLADVMAQADVRPAPVPVEAPEVPAIKAFIEGADDERWLNVIGVMNRAEDPAAAAVAAMLAKPAKHEPKHEHGHEHGH